MTDRHIDRHRETHRLTVHMLLASPHAPPTTLTDRQAGSRRGLRCAMLRTYIRVTQAVADRRTDGHMDGQTLCDNKG